MPMECMLSVILRSYEFYESEEKKLELNFKCVFLRVTRSVSFKDFIDVIFHITFLFYVGSSFIYQ